MITITVTSVNDPPVLKKTRGKLEPLPYELSAGWNAGTFIKDIFDQSKTDPLAEDIDNRTMELGAVILSAKNGSLGRWLYQMNSSVAFEYFAFDKDAGEVFLLPPTARYMNTSNMELNLSGSMRSRQSKSQDNADQ